MEKLEATGSAADQKPAVRQWHKCSNENIAAVRESVCMNPGKFVFKRSQELGISSTTTWEILQEGLSFHPYKLVLSQELKPNDSRSRRVFSDWVVEQFEVDPAFNHKIIFSDDVLFHI